MDPLPEELRRYFEKVTSKGIRECDIIRCTYEEVVGATSYQCRVQVDHSSSRQLCFLHDKQVKLRILIANLSTCCSEPRNITQEEFERFQHDLVAGRESRYQFRYGPRYNWRSVKN